MVLHHDTAIEAKLHSLGGDACLYLDQGLQTLQSLLVTDLNLVALPSYSHQNYHSY